jgi:hypothetical protein
MVSDMYIALFSRFTTCGSWEGHNILDYLVENDSDVLPDTIHADTQGQSAATVGADQKNVEWRVIGLPNRVRPIRFSPVHQLECVAVRLRPFMGERDQIDGQRGDDAIDNPIARRFLSQILCQSLGLTADRCNWNRRLL